MLLFSHGNLENVSNIENEYSGPNLSEVIVKHYLTEHKMNVHVLSEWSVVELLH